MASRLIGIMAGAYRAGHPIRLGVMSNPGHNPPPPRPLARHTFPARMRLTHNTEFDAVYGAKMKKVGLPMLLFSMPNSKPHARLGLSIGRSLGNAVVRNRCKRLVREAFRLTQHDLPMHGGGGYDFIVALRGPDVPALPRLCGLLLSLASESHREWEKRRARERTPERKDAEA